MVTAPTTTRITVHHGGLRRTGVILAKPGVGVVRLRKALDAIRPAGGFDRLERDGAGHGRQMWDTEVRAGRKQRQPAIFVRGCYGFRRAIYDALVSHDHKLIAVAELGRRS